MYPGWNPYNYCVGNPLVYVDPDGEEIWITVRDAEENPKDYVQYKDGELYYGNGKKYTGNNKYLLTVKSVLNKLLSLGNSYITRMLQDLVNNKNYRVEMEKDPRGSGIVYPYLKDDIERAKLGGKMSATRLLYDYNETYLEKDNITQTPESLLSHELQHSYDYMIGNMKDSNGKSGYRDPAEWRAVDTENVIRVKTNMQKRMTYDGHDISKKIKW